MLQLRIKVPHLGLQNDSQRSDIPLVASLLANTCTLRSGFAKAQVAVPSLSGHVIDQTGTITQDQKATLEQALSAFEARKGSQLAVLIIPTTYPEAIEQYALRVAEQWKLGRQKVDDGVILVEVS